MAYFRQHCFIRVNNIKKTFRIRHIFRQHYFIRVNNVNKTFKIWHILGNIVLYE